MIIITTRAKQQRHYTLTCLGQFVQPQSTLLEGMTNRKRSKKFYRNSRWKKRKWRIILNQEEGSRGVLRTYLVRDGITYIEITLIHQMLVSIIHLSLSLRNGQIMAHNTELRPPVLVKNLFSSLIEWLKT